MQHQVITKDYPVQCKYEALQAKEEAPSTAAQSAMAGEFLCLALSKKRGRMLWLHCMAIICLYLAIHLICPYQFNDVRTSFPPLCICAEHAPACSWSGWWPSVLLLPLSHGWQYLLPVTFPLGIREWFSGGITASPPIRSEWRGSLLNATCNCHNTMLLPGCEEASWLQCFGRACRVSCHTLKSLLNACLCHPCGRGLRVWRSCKPVQNLSSFYTFRTLCNPVDWWILGMGHTESFPVFAKIWRLPKCIGVNGEAITKGGFQGCSGSQVRPVPPPVPNTAPHGLIVFRFSPTSILKVTVYK